MKSPKTEDVSVASEELSSRRAQLLSSLKTFIVILSSSIISFIAFRNTLHWYLQRFWGASGDFWESQWAKVLDRFDHNEFNVGVIGTFTVTFCVYWIVGAFYTFVDLTGKPSFLLKYKIQDNSNSYPVTRRQLIRVIRQVIINQIFVGIPFCLIGHYSLRWRGYEWGKLPTFQWVLLELSICILIEELVFYYSHRLLHNPRIYKYIHKKHHEWTAPIAITAIYCHPIEHIFSNLLPPLLGPLILGSHTATAWLWFTLAILSTLNAHCGYHFPFLPSPEAHDFHHLKFNQNFGVLGVLDRLHGTDSMFRKTKAYERHVMLLSLVPIKELYPDDSKNTSTDDSCSSSKIE
jgi:sterol desaturase/sphingolipid hydroxylase (fatty acid hydroxylase superfamily)